MRARASGLRPHQRWGVSGEERMPCILQLGTSGSGPLSSSGTKRADFPLAVWHCFSRRDNRPISPARPEREALSPLGGAAGRLPSPPGQMRRPILGALCPLGRERRSQGARTRSPSSRYARAWRDSCFVAARNETKDKGALRTARCFFLNVQATAWIPLLLSRGLAHKKEHGVRKQLVRPAST